MVEVVNIRKCKPLWGQPGDVRVDRTSEWGNPFFMRIESDRDKVCNDYEVYILRMIEEGKLSIDELKNAKRLGCWCKPKRCHSDFLKKLLDEYHAKNPMRIE